MSKVPIPPADKPRIQDIHQLPVLFANARPQVGLAHEKRKKDIDKEIAAFFSTGKKLYAVGGEHTKTFPQQRGLTFTTVTSEVLLEGLDGRYYKGTVDESSRASKDESDETKTRESENQSDAIQNEDANNVVPSPAVLTKTTSKVRRGTKIAIPANRSKQATNQARSAMSTQSGTQVAASSSVGEKDVPYVPPPYVPQAFKIDGKIYKCRYIATV
ncbi:uncharacterized protein TNCT_73211 [Trichonephila clavata]|uniref:Uncharacterized protein n=1 Tax=Trichonephila clavata TaxID=2740835 RepID=A0A8X6GL50_TRICU|nr:uncharacterized protein TNCT_73211 [Trichonephila clavata]